jgi:uncharacterized protein (TIGR03435 family)
VTGADLKRRIELIMQSESVTGLSVPRRLALAALAISATVGPVVVGALIGTRVNAQVTAPAADAPVFEAASVKPSAPGGRIGGRGTPGRFTATGLSLRRLIRQAYDIHESQIVGGPEWVETQGFDVNATAGDQPPGMMRVMMQTLLRDRFKLVFHNERREMPIYALVMARADGRLGDGLRPVPENECPAPGAVPAGPPPPLPSPSDPDPKPPCGSVTFGPGRLVAHGAPLEMLVRSIANLPAITAFNRIVKDETGLKGTYDFDLKWAAEIGRFGGPPPGGAPPPSANPADEPALVTALREQLGLKLEPRRAVVDVMVIDSAEKPADN